MAEPRTLAPRPQASVCRIRHERPGAAGAVLPLVQHTAPLGYRKHRQGRQNPMPQVSINELHLLTGKARATITKNLDSLPFAEGPKQAKLYDSKAALAKLYLAPSE